jgi:hypothetical protein
VLVVFYIIAILGALIGWVVSSGVEPDANHLIDLM